MDGLSYWHEPGEHPLLYVTLGKVLGQAAELYEEQEFLISMEEDVRMSYRDALHQADRLAAGLRALGLQRGDRVAIWGPNTCSWIISYLAVARAGLVSVLMNPLLRAPEATHCLSLAQVSAVVVGDNFRDVDFCGLLGEICPELPSSKPGQLRSSALPQLRAVITMDAYAPPGVLRFRDVLASAAEKDVSVIIAEQHKISPDSSCSILFSSGTTGKPKAIVLAHRSVVNSGMFTGRRLGMHKKRHTVCLLPPMFHVFGSVIVPVPSLLFGAPFVIPGKVFNATTALRALRRERCSMLTGVPTMFVDMLRAVEGGEPAPDSLEVSLIGGAVLAPETIIRINALFGEHKIRNIYGLTETSGAFFQTDEDATPEQITSTVGRVIDSTEVKVVDHDNNLVPFGTPGQLCVRSLCVMKEYFQNDDATRKALEDGWFRTGDQFILEADGYGRIVGRLNDLIIRGGENIYPKEVEDVLASHPDILQVEVVSVPDERMGEEVCACLLVRGQVHLSSSHIKRFCMDKMAPHKIPRYCVILPEFPHTLTGKIKKYVLRQTCEKLLREKKLDDSKAISP